MVRTILRALPANFSDNETRRDSGTRSEKQRAITIVNVKTPLIISAPRYPVAKLIIKLLDNQKKSRTKQSRNFS